MVTINLVALLLVHASEPRYREMAKDDFTTRHSMVVEIRDLEVTPTKEEEEFDTIKRCYNHGDLVSCRDNPEAHVDVMVRKPWEYQRGPIIVDQLTTMGSWLVSYVFDGGTGLVEENQAGFQLRESEEGQDHWAFFLNMSAKVPYKYEEGKNPLRPSFVRTHLAGKARVLEKVYFTDEEEAEHQDREDLLNKVSIKKFIFSQKVLLPFPTMRFVPTDGGMSWELNAVKFIGGRGYQWDQKAGRYIDVLTHEHVKRLPKGYTCRLYSHVVNDEPRTIPAGFTYHVVETEDEGLRYKLSKESEMFKNSLRCGNNRGHLYPTLEDMRGALGDVLEVELNPAKLL